jgi:LmbE family N-acetylglucosaminyl deacetylase
VVLAPHPDDAVLSCGGTLHRLRRHGVSATVITVFGGGPEASDPDGHPPPGEPSSSVTVTDAGTRLSPLAEALHRRWSASLSGEHAPPVSAGVGTDVGVALAEQRRREDEAALGLLGVDGRWWPYADCIYRRRDDGGWVCADEADLFVGPEPPEPVLVDMLASGLARVAGHDAVLLAPLAVGNHVDHHRTREAARSASDAFRQLLYYEDYPYASDAAYEPARGLAPEQLRSEAVPLRGCDIGAKIAAAACYRSQISTFWEGEAAMAGALWAFARLRGEGGDLLGAISFGERLFTEPVS